MKLNWLDWPLRVMESPGTFGTVGTSAGIPPSKRNDNMALSATVIVSRSSEAVNVAAAATTAPLTTMSTEASSKRKFTFTNP